MPDTAIVTDISVCLGHKRPVGSASAARACREALPAAPGSDRAGGWRTLPHVARVVVEVMLKPEIHDPQGEAIASACHRLGFGQVVGPPGQAVRGRARRRTADEAAVARVAELAGELLANR